MHEQHRSITNTYQEAQSNELIYIPNEIMLLIFKYLTFRDWARLQAVSKRWKYLLRHNYLWGNAKFLWGHTGKCTVLPYHHKKLDRTQFQNTLIREEVNNTGLKFNNIPVTLPFFGKSNPVKSGKQKAKVNNIRLYYDLAKVSFSALNSADAYLSVRP